MQFRKKKYNDLEKPAESVVMIVMKKAAGIPTPYSSPGKFARHTTVTVLRPRYFQISLQRVSKYEKLFVCKQDSRALR
jgi:hypothetical protein